MCGRYTVIKHDQIIRVIFNITLPANLRFVARYNVAPSQLVPVVTSDSKEVQMFRWGLIPSWAKDEKIGYTMINARAETLADKRAFRTALQRRRCLLPADGFYEWQKGADGKSKTPMYIRMHGGTMFAFAGLWETWRNPSGEEIKSCTIITTSPNSLTSPIHDRMPAIIPREHYSNWLAPGDAAAPDLMRLLQPYPAAQMEAYPVRTLVNSPKNEGPELIQKTETLPSEPSLW